ncbi:MAG: cytochrome c biogenesis protein CcdA [Corynebacteriales bacterium]|nr:cytochrome c biogenesis protein CcdA [Mycobacteriales bacterium]
MSSFANTVTDGPLLAAIGVSALAGFVSFASPCVLPLVPGYLSYVTGMSGADADNSKKWRTVAGSALFVAGFTAVFVLIGATVGTAATWLLVHQQTIERVVGVGIVLLGLAFLGAFPWLLREKRIRKLPASGLAGAPILGAVFALGWVPCISPTLAAVQGLSFLEGSAERGVTLSIAYALGLGLPFLAIALGLSWATGTVAFLRKQSRWIARAGGVMLIIIGLMLVTGWWQDAMIWLRSSVGPGEIGI